MDDTELATVSFLKIWLLKIPLNICRVSVYDRIWSYGYAPFAYHGSTTILVVSPFHMVLWTCSPTAVVDLVRRRNDIFKPVREVDILNVHGPTVTASDGECGKRYRKVTTACFGRHMFEGAWYESVRKAESLVKRFITSAEYPGRVKKELEVVTFAVVSEVCLGISVSSEGEMILKRHTPHRHKMSYWESFAVSAEYMGVTYLTPKSILKNSPLEAHRVANTSNEEWRKYMEDMLVEKRLEIEAIGAPKDPNLLGEYSSLHSTFNSRLLTV